MAACTQQLTGLSECWEFDQMILQGNFLENISKYSAGIS
jgi:hypothetical protein